MSFSSLPPELVHQIVESTVPHTFHSTTYKERQRTLCSLSLVSKLFRSIAQPLLLEIVKLKRLQHVEKLPTTRASGGVLTRRAIRSLIIEWDGRKEIERTKGEKDRFVESIRVLRTARDLTVWHVAQDDFDNLLSIVAHQLTSLHLTACQWKEPVRTHLPNLRNLILCGVSFELFDSLVDPATVPNLRNFAFIKGGEVYMEDLARSGLDQLLLQLETLNVAARAWFDPQATFLHSAASRTLVNFSSWNVERLDSSTNSLQHVRIIDSSPHSVLFSYDQLQRHLDRWSTYIQNNSSLSLKSIYLDSSLHFLSTLPAATQTRLETLTRVCQERKIDLVFETVPLDYTLDPNISSEFMRRQKEQRKKESRKSGERTKLNE
ncbi:hypothetical protein JCM3765_004580 [Sporobolomyces pararoseus]